MSEFSITSDVFKALNEIKDFEFKKLRDRLKVIGGEYVWDYEFEETPYAVFTDRDANAVSINVTSVRLDDKDVRVDGIRTDDGCSVVPAWSNELRPGDMTEILNYLPKTVQ